MAIKGQDLHPSMVRYGLQVHSLDIVGSNSRAIALAQAFRDVISDYETPAGETLSRHLDAHLKHQINYVVACRPNAVSTGALIRYVKLEIASIAHDMPDSDAKAYLDEQLLNYVNDRIVMPGVAIAEHCSPLMGDEDVIMVYSMSTLVLKVITAAQQIGVKFRVVVVDSRPLFEGKKMLSHLLQACVDCTYCDLSGIAYHMPHVSKVLLGAHAMLGNGALMSRSGTGMVALMAREHGKPVVVACESYKFSERVQLDSFVLNELGDSEVLVKS